MEKENTMQNSANKELFINISIAIAIMIYFIFINLGYTNIATNILEIDLKVFALLFLGIAIFIFEIAYKKDNGILSIYGIETLILASYTLSIMHVVTICNFYFKYYILASSYIFAIYYVLKDIIIYTRERKKYLNSLSDIAEIVKKDEPNKKEAKKRKGV